MATFDTGLNQVLPYVEGCPDMLALLHLRNAAIEFCERSLVWQATLTPIVTVLNQRTYNFAPALPADSVVAKLLSVRRGGVPMTLASEVAGDSPQAPLDTVGTTALRSQLVLGMAPQAGQQLVARVALKPSQAAVDFDDGLFEQYIEAIAQGAIARLQAIPSKAWTADPTTARSNFERAINSATATVAKSATRMTLPTTPSYF